MARHTTQLFEADLTALVAQYEGRISTAEGIGVLVLKVIEIARAAQENGDEDADED